MCNNYVSVFLQQARQCGSVAVSHDIRRAVSVYVYVVHIEVCMYKYDKNIHVCMSCFTACMAYRESPLGVLLPHTQGPSPQQPGPPAHPHARSKSSQWRCLHHPTSQWHTRTSESSIFGSSRRQGRNRGRGRRGGRIIILRPHASRAAPGHGRGGKGGAWTGREGTRHST